MAVRGDSSLRTRFHNVPVNLPSPPSVCMNILTAFQQKNEISY